MIRLQPDAHRERAGAKDVRPLDAADRGQLRLDNPCQIISDLILVEVLGIKTQVGGGELVIAGLELDDGRFGFGRQIVAHLGDFRLNLCERCVVVVVDLQMHRDGAQSLRAFGFDVVDAVRAGDDALQRRGDESAHKVRVRSHIGRLDGDDGDVAARVLPHVEAANRLQTRQQNDQVDHGRHDQRRMNKSVNFMPFLRRRSSYMFGGFGLASLPGWTLLLTSTAAPPRSLNTPELTTSSPSLTPEMTVT